MTSITLPAMRPAATVSPVPTRIQRRKTASRRALRSRSVHWTANLILVVACSMTAIATVGSIAGWWRAETVLSGSMRPGIQPGDVEILQTEPVSSLRVGQIIAFHPPKDRFTISHRVIAIHQRTGTHAGTWITTRGDANNVPDPWGSVRLLGHTVWVVKGVVPGVGFLSVWAREVIPHLALIVAIVLLISVMALEVIWRQ